MRESLTEREKVVGRRRGVPATARGRRTTETVVVPAGFVVAVWFQCLRW
ncbi:hypothetical protein A2U01_0090929 [Trifolium medium]|uniref:Uncharacterized protein n=1 Tax=Trifolium medium TaxID=97028 RepID=A0A392UB71_9FABA|nr:hypothetical protein [Trifolium medium]